MQLKEGILFDDRYLLIKVLGSGGYSEVWLAEDTKVGHEKRALKVYAPGKGLEDDGVKLFSREFQLVYDLNHTYLLRPSHFDVCERSPYLVLPYCNRGSAAKLTGKITEEEAWHFLHDIASGLAYLHEQIEPVIHQDIKPDNVLIDQNGKYLITDFGISAKARNTLRKSVGNVKSGGTIAYMAPERFGQDNKPIKASDIWSLGATLYELMEGDAPFGEHGGLIQKSGADIPNITGDYSRNLKEIVHKMLVKDTLSRPTAVQLVEWTDAHKRGEDPFEKDKKKKSRDIESSNGKGGAHVVSKPPPSKPQESTRQPKNKETEKPLKSAKTPKLQKLKAKKYILAAVGMVIIVLAIVIVQMLKEQKRQEIARIEDENRQTQMQGLLVAEGDSLYSIGLYKNALEKYNEAASIMSGGTVRYDIQEKIEVARINEAENRQKEEFLSKLNIEMVFVEGGTFMMGCPANKGDACSSDEKPSHQVTLSDFYIGKYEVTQAQWEAVMGNNPSSRKGDNYPVTNVKWNDTQEFIQKLNELTGKQFRLPTEAEWEFAARGGNSSKGYTLSGSNKIEDVAWVDGGFRPVGSKRPNELGIYDMSGNVYEWCNDWYGKYSSSATTNPTGPASGPFRILRGGSWHFVTNVWDRGYYSHVMLVSYFGFRLAHP